MNKCSFQTYWTRDRWQVPDAERAEIEGVVAKGWIEAKLSGLQVQITRILERSVAEDRPPHQIAIEIAGKRMAMAR